MLMKQSFIGKATDSLPNNSKNEVVSSLLCKFWSIFCREFKRIANESRLPRTNRFVSFKRIDSFENRLNKTFAEFSCGMLSQTGILHLTFYRIYLSLKLWKLWPFSQSVSVLLTLKILKSCHFRNVPQKI
jgi:hypothetical protein